MRTHRGRWLALAVMLALGACTSGSDATDTFEDDGSGDTPATSPARVTPGVPKGAFFLDLRTGTQTPLASTGIEGDPDVTFDDGNYYVPSPDGSRIYWESVTNTSAVARSDGSRGQRLDPTGTTDYYAGGWSPDGTKIVYQRRDGSTDDFGDLVVEDMASGRTTRLIDLDRFPDGVYGLWYLAPTFSPDGRNVIFQWPHDSSSGAKWALWSVPVTGGEPTLLVRNAAQAITNGGRTWAFVRPTGDFFGGASIVIAAPDGFRKLVEATSEIFEPKMSPDGSRIAYQDGDAIYVVDVSTGEASEVAVGRMASWVDDDTLIVAPGDD